jgi:hypothetical protein
MKAKKTKEELFIWLFGNDRISSTKKTKNQNVLLQLGRAQLDGAIRFFVVAKYRFRDREEIVVEGEGCVECRVVSL